MASLKAAVRPFRGLRFVPSRVEMGAVVGRASAGADPRHVQNLLETGEGPDDGKNAPVRRARLRLAEWRRAGIVKRDEQPAVYAVRRRAPDGSESLGIFCALAVDGVGAVADSAREARLDGLGVAVEPVVARFDEARVKRTVENAIDREADAAWRVGDASLELWCIDEESTTARVATLLSQAGVDVVSNADAMSAQAAWCKKLGTGNADDDRPRAASFALAFLHPVDDAWPDIPVGAALAPLTGLLG